MQIQYFKSAWGDIKNSPGWFGKLCLLALLNFVPIFGQIVTFAYLYGWAREIAWGTHEPLPAKIFSNDDGKFWRRGWFVLVLTIVFALVPQVVMQVGNAIQGTGMVFGPSGHVVSSNPLMMGIGSIVFIIGWLGALLLSVLTWIGCMRVSIYDRLSAGFQLGKIWKMLRYDTTGILKIFGMNLLVGIIIGIIISIIISILLFIVLAVGMAGVVSAGYTIDSLQHLSQPQAVRLVAQFAASAGVIGVLAMLATMFLVTLSTSFLSALVYRAVGYWTMQFDVPHWAGQDDPMPFERTANGAQPAQPQYGFVPPQQPQQQPYDPAQQFTQQPAGQPQQPFGSAPQPYDAAQQPAPQPFDPVAQSTEQVPQPQQPAAPQPATTPLEPQAFDQVQQATTPLEAPLQQDPVADSPYAHAQGAQTQPVVESAESAVAEDAPQGESPRSDE